MGFFHPKLYTGFAIVDAGYAANAFAYIYLPDQKRLLEHKTIRPRGFSETFDPEFTSEWKLGDFSITSVDGKTIAKCASSKFDLEIELANNAAGLSSICPAGDRPYNFTYKNVGLRGSTNVRVGAQAYAVEGQYGSVDFSKGYPPRETVWRWASVAGTLEDGTPFGANLVAEHNADLENAYWIDGEAYTLGPARFVFDKNAPMTAPWEIKTDCGRLALFFTPQSGRAEKINALVVKHDFSQPCGFFEGFLKHKGESRRLSGYGVTESHHSVW